MGRENNVCVCVCVCRCLCVCVCVWGGEMGGWVAGVVKWFVVRA